MSSDFDERAMHITLLMLRKLRDRLRRDYQKLKG
jgi:hypothetical protein